MNIIRKSLCLELLEYDSESGILSWKERGRHHFSSNRSWAAWNSRFSGKEAGHLHLGTRGARYRTLRIFGTEYKAHRVVMSMHGFDTDGMEVDHIDGNSLNNRIENLRVVNRTANGRNQKIRNTNKSGVTGVSWIARQNSWRAYINDSGRSVPLCNTNDFFEAVCARKSAEIRLGYHENHGRR